MAMVAGMNKRPAIFVVSQAGAALAQKMRQTLDAEIVGLAGRVEEADQLVDKISDSICSAFDEKRPILAVLASGALIRILAPKLRDKNQEPPVLAISEDGASIVPLLGGHHGANELARELTTILDGHAAITTAGDLRFGIALDDPPEGFVLGNPQNAKPVMAALLAGASARLIGEADWLTRSGIPFDENGEVRLITSEKKVDAGPLDLVFHPQSLIVGMGCERDAPADEAWALVESAVEKSGYARQSIAAVTSIDLKADERALHVVAQRLGVPAIFYPAARLEEERDRLHHPSDIVFGEVGCHGVAEGAALAASGKNSELVIPKEKSKRVTFAMAKSPDFLNESKIMSDTGRKRGKLFVVGIGPGQEAWRSPEVSRMIGAATDLVGYSLYLDLIGDISSGKIRHDFDLGKEEDRVRHAMELAGTGKDVALVCSGDAGIYAMATLVFELLQNGGLSDGAGRIEIAVSPGISALQAAAARAGAPLGHDFCTISLSDLLTPWEAIQMRVKAAAEGDFVIAFYNPVSKRRRTQLAYARDILLQHRPADTPVILATDLGRPAEKVRVVPLCELNIDDVDMLTVVIVGSSETRTVQTGDGKTWVYTPRGYAAKEGTRIGVQSGDAA